MSNRRFDLKDESPILFLSLGAVTVILTGLVFVVVGFGYFLLASGFQPGHNPSAGIDASGSHDISFANDQQSYFYRDNKPGDSAKTTRILIIYGVVRNDYQEPRSFIKLRGHLLGDDEKILADRFVYAGNTLSEEELKTLPLNEIYARLMIKGGDNNTNKNVAPGTEIPFMVVFGDLPDGMKQYRIDVVGSEPAE